MMEIIKYNSKFKNDFIKFNKDWIIDNFGFLEKEDIETFNNIEQHLKTGSMIYMAVKNDILLAGCMIKKDNESEWEICKLCSNKSVEHRGAGTAVFKSCMDFALKNGAKKIYILTNTGLKAAIHIYKKFGFKEIKLNDYHYKRGNIAFEFVPGEL